ncbi:MAG: hypothetical protein KAY12_04600 [Arenimonas sp.]|nr:hypothetical protein [Arenimonas sp.]MBP8098063.1 hypothetical protein [Arenimonas sp.]
MPAGSDPVPRGKQVAGELFGFEHRRHRVLPWPAFLRRMLISLALGTAVVGGSLAFGMIGYHHFEGLSAVDSFLNASMILSGMGPVDDMRTDAGKLFAGFYALYSGLAVLATAGLIFAPLIHRMLHRFHADESDETSE